MRRYFFLAAAAATALLMGLPAVSASAASTAVLTTGSAAGPAAAVNDVLTAGLSSGTTANFFTDTTDTTGVFCSTSSFSATVTANPAPPGTAGESLTNQAFSNCTTNISGASSVQDVTLNNLPYSGTVSDSGNSVTLTGPLSTTITLNTFVGTVVCTYTTPSIVGTASNTDNSITFTNQPFTLSNGSIACFSNGFFSATYAPVVDSSQPGSPSIFTN
jgi:hypothetical protein